MEAIAGGASLIQSSNRLLRDKSLSFSSPGRWRGVRLKPAKLRSSISWSRSDFYGERIRSVAAPKRSSCRVFSVDAQMITGNLGLAKAMKWWEKGLKPNMKEVTGAQDLVDSLLNAGDKLVVVDFFSPGCGGCKALHPKLCQLAEMNPDVQFLQVNYEEHKPMCYSLGVHVLPFFRFYRGAQGKVCSFSCTNATIKKFKDALAKHTPDRCSLGPTKGLEEKELLALSANREVPFTYTPKQIPAPEKDVAAPEPVPSHFGMDFPFPAPQGGQKPSQESEERTLVNSGR